MDKFLFLDRDDTLIYDVPYLSNPDLVRLTPGAGTALASLGRAGYRLVLVTNQSGIGRGMFSVEDLHRVNARIQELLAEDGASLDAVYFCPHGPEEGCSCRKPRTGMLEKACQDFAVELGHSYVIGDSQGDIGMGKAFGLKTIQIRLPGRDKPDLGADFLARDLMEAARYLLEKNA